MHKGKLYPYANETRPIAVAAWDWPNFPAKRYDFTVPHWVDQIGVHPVVGTFTTDPVSYTPGDRFATWDVSIPCDVGHTVTVRLKVELAASGIATVPTGTVIVDGIPRGFSTIVNGANGQAIDWGNWGGAIGTTVAPQNSGSAFPTHLATPWP